MNLDLLLRTLAEIYRARGIDLDYTIERRK